MFEAIEVCCRLANFLSKKTQVLIFVVGEAAIRWRMNTRMLVRLFPKRSARMGSGGMLFAFCCSHPFDFRCT